MNADRDDTNGCECASNPSVADEPERFASYPTAGLPYVDRDCDQVDGIAASSLFVWAQSPSSLGTRAAPFRTITEAIAAFRPAQHVSILVAQGTYAEQVVLTNGVQVSAGTPPTSPGATSFFCPPSSKRASRWATSRVAPSTPRRSVSALCSAASPFAATT